jgi:hypothetical protein
VLRVTHNARISVAGLCHTSAARTPLMTVTSARAMHTLNGTVLAERLTSIGNGTI